MAQQTAVDLAFHTVLSSVCAEWGVSSRRTVVYIKRAQQRLTWPAAHLANDGRPVITYLVSLRRRAAQRAVSVPLMLAVARGDRSHQRARVECALRVSAREARRRDNSGNGVGLTSRREAPAPPDPVRRQSRRWAASPRVVLAVVEARASNAASHGRRCGYAERAVSVETASRASGWTVKRRTSRRARHRSSRPRDAGAAWWSEALLRKVPRAQRRE